MQSSTFYISAVTGNKGILMKFLDRRYLKINLQDVEGQSATFSTAQIGDADIARLLVETDRLDLKISDAMLQRKALLLLTMKAMTTLLLCSVKSRGFLMLQELKL